jgi:hypothetical protein
MLEKLILKAWLWLGLIKPSQSQAKLKNQGSCGLTLTSRHSAPRLAHTIFLFQIENRESVLRIRAQFVVN